MDYKVCVKCNTIINSCKCGSGDIAFCKCDDGEIKICKCGSGDFISVPMLMVDITVILRTKGYDVTACGYGTLFLEGDYQGGAMFVSFGEFYIFDSIPHGFRYDYCPESSDKDWSSLSAPPSPDEPYESQMHPLKLLNNLLDWAAALPKGEKVIRERSWQYMVGDYYTHTLANIFKPDVFERNYELLMQIVPDMREENRDFHNVYCFMDRNGLSSVKRQITIDYQTRNSIASISYGMDAHGYIDYDFSCQLLVDKDKKMVRDKMLLSGGDTAWNWESIETVDDEGYYLLSDDEGDEDEEEDEDLPDIDTNDVLTISLNLILKKLNEQGLIHTADDCW